MLERDFMWRGRLASEMGVLVTKQAQYKHPAKRVNTYTVPGRSGTLTALEEPSWEEVVYAPECAMVPGADREAITAWLQGTGDLTFGSMPDFTFRARIDSAFDTTALVEGVPNGYLLFSPVFTCHPERRQQVPERTITTGPGSVSGWNPGNIAAAPRLTIAATGAADITLQITQTDPDSSTETTQRVGIHLGGATSGMVYDAATGQISGAPAAGWSITSGTLDTFPRLQPGAWTLTISGPAGVTVAMEPRYRWI